MSSHVKQTIGTYIQTRLCADLHAFNHSMFSQLERDLTDFKYNDAEDIINDVSRLAGSGNLKAALMRV